VASVTQTGATWALVFGTTYLELWKADHVSGAGTSVSVAWSGTPHASSAVFMEYSGIDEIDVVGGSAGEVNPQSALAAETQNGLHIMVAGLAALDSGTTLSGYSDWTESFSEVADTYDYGE
jgi:hypothetical protein